MLREPAELHVDDQGRVELPLGLLAEAGIAPGTDLVAFSDGDGRIVLRRAEDAIRDFIEKGML
ncbi:AbrB/MazE/SpoVT family DNA-binding domain-containing protein [Streptomyces sp. NBC_00663]|uniref:AbrB/MazE/SpoVT family DNA-binding domain-containing protein n=1 Tax=Streptomyces sp. NBC_00663 TaxID=2975801 RepID=UPI002E36E9C5|nr:AbrB/MazE/SpoVT family DNA-binding domain-containing protein [Streptomyces sp. NBC_00663]